MNNKDSKNKKFNIELDFITFKNLNKCISILEEELNCEISGMNIISRAIGKYLEYLFSSDIDFSNEFEFYKENKSIIKSKNENSIIVNNKPDNKNNSDIINVYTDGACAGNPGPAGIGIVIYHNDNIKEYSEYIGEATNNIAELKAVKFALEKIKSRNAIINIFIDSKYTIGVLSQDWKPKANIELITSIKNIMEKYTNLNFKWIKGHSGDPFNEKADQIANNAIMKKIYKY